MPTKDDPLSHIAHSLDLTVVPTNPQSLQTGHARLLFFRPQLTGGTLGCPTCAPQEISPIYWPGVNVQTRLWEICVLSVGQGTTEAKATPARPTDSGGVSTCQLASLRKYFPYLADEASLFQIIPPSHRASFLFAVYLSH